MSEDEMRRPLYKRQPIINRVYQQPITSIHPQVNTYAYQSLAATTLAQRGIIKINENQMTLVKPLASLSSNDIQMLKNLGFNISQTQVTQAKQQAGTSSRQQDELNTLKSHGVVSEANGKISLAVPLYQVSGQDLIYLKDIGFNIPQQAESQRAYINYLQSKGVLKVSGTNLTLAKPISQLSNNDIDMLNKLGFNVSQQSRDEYQSLSNLTSNGVFTTNPTPGKLKSNYLPQPTITVGNDKYYLSKDIASLSNADIKDLNAIGIPITKQQRDEAAKVQNSMNTLVNSGAAVVQNGKVLLKTPMNQLPDNLYDAAQNLGFKTTTQGKSWVRSLYDWVEGNQAKGGPVGGIMTYSPNQATKSEKNIAALGGLEGVIGGVLSFISFGAFNYGNYKTVSPSTIKLAKSLPQSEKYKLDVMYLGGALLGDYVTMKGVGFATDTVFAGASKIAKGLGVKTPSGVAKIASKIAKNPKLSRYVQNAVVVGLNTPTLVSLYQTGIKASKGQANLDDFALQIAESAAGIYVGIKGFESGAKASKDFRAWLKNYRKGGKAAEMPIGEIMPAQAQNTGRYMEYQKQAKSQWSKEFKALARKFEAEDYLGKLTDDKYRLWHGSTGEFSETGTHTVQSYYTISEEWAAKHGKFEGLYLSPGASPLRLGTGVGSGKSRMVLPGGSSPTVFALDVWVDVMPKGMNRAELLKWLSKAKGKQTAYIPPTNLISREMEAVLPKSTAIVRVETGPKGKGWYTNWAGQDISVEKWAIVSDEATLAMLKSLPKSAGIEVSTIGEVASRSSMSTFDKVMAIGIAPPSSYVNSTLSDAQISKLAKTYNLSESEVRSVVSSLGANFSEAIASINSPSSSLSITPEELSSVLNPTSSVPGESSIPVSSLPSISELPSSVNEPSVPPPKGIDLLKSQLEYNPREGKTQVPETFKTFEVKLYYYMDSETFKIRAQTFKGATYTALQRRHNASIPSSLTVRVIQHGSAV